jgi:hypothetical protein
MRAILLGLVASFWLGLAMPAQAEQRMFIVANDADGYGIDRCLASGARCGAAAANAYCKTQDFAEAAIYHKVDRNDITRAAPTGTAVTCHDDRCDVVAIVCTR